MGVEQGLLALVGAADFGGAYQIEQSLRFNWTSDSTRLYRTFSSDNSNANFTISFWCKRAQLGAYNSFIAAQTNAANYEHWMWYNTDAIGSSNGVGGTANNNTSTARFRDPSAWYHVVWKNIASGATTVYINNTQVLSFTRQHKAVNKNVNHNIGVGADSGSFGANFYLAEYHLVDGSALEPSSFAEPDDNGVWRPIRYTGSYGTNGFYLKFDPSATNGIGHDHSGNGNNFTATGFTTSGTGTDVMSDTPTTNYATLNPLRMNGTVALSASLADGNLYFKSSSQYKTAIASIGMSTGKWYFEAETANAGGTGDANLVGIEIEGNPGANHFISSDPNGVTTGYGYLNVNGNLRGGTAAADDQTGGPTWTAGDIIGVTYDADAGQAKWYKNNTLVYTKSGLSGTWFFAVSGYDSSQSNSHFYANFGQRAFAYTPPTGFKALNTANLPEPDIADGSANFNTVLYSGNSSTQTISGVGFQPDLIYVKARSTAQGPSWYNAISGFNKILMSTTSTNGDTTDTGGLNGVTSDGFTLDGNNAAIGGTNGSGQTYVAWNWLAGNGTSSNTDGSITSTVSANPSAGFSIVSFNKNTANTVTSTFGHGLGVAPKMIIAKHRDQSDNWRVYTETTGASARLNLNTADAVITPTNTWGNTAPTSTVFSMEGVLTGEYVAYCFAEVEGYSKFGSYTGNGNADGPFVYCGFRPAWIMIRSTSGSRNWAHVDSTRSYANVANHTLATNRNDGESYYGNGESVFGALNKIDLLSNGFKPRENATWANGSGETYIFAAFAENPFGGSGVSPATAR